MITDDKELAEIEKSGLNEKMLKVYNENIDKIADVFFDTITKDEKLIYSKEETYYYILTVLSVISSNCILNVLGIRDDASIDMIFVDIKTSVLNCNAHLKSISTVQ